MMSSGKTMRGSKFWGLVILVLFLCTLSYRGYRFLIYGSRGPSQAAGVSASNAHSRQPALAFDDNNVYLAWQEGLYDKEIYLKKWDGERWGEIGNSASGGGVSQSGHASNPSIGVAPDGKLYVAWSEGERGAIFIKVWDGNSWQEVSTGSAKGFGISGGFAPAQAPTVFFSDDGHLSVAWLQTQDSYDINGRSFDGTIWTALALSDDDSLALLKTASAKYEERVPPSILIDDYRYSITGIDAESLRVTYWNAVLREDISPEFEVGADNPILAFDENGRLYLAWEDETYGEYDFDGYITSDIFLLMWDGTTWQEVGDCSGATHSSCR